eukprot:1907855-Alexandrium_andersonii.AAC.1
MVLQATLDDCERDVLRVVVLDELGFGHPVLELLLRRLLARNLAIEEYDAAPVPVAVDPSVE